MKIASLNLNGLRSACRKGLVDWVQHVQPDILCCQEMRVDETWMSSGAGDLPGWRVFSHCATVKKGYSGVAVYTKDTLDVDLIPLEMTQLGVCDEEGRVIGVCVGEVAVFSTYFPSGSSGEERQSCKYAFLEAFYDAFRRWQSHYSTILLCGDWNIAHQNLDIKNWRSNQKNSGFLPEERAWLSRFLQDYAMVDVFRGLYPEEPGYTWWSNRGRAYDNNVGWRIDYHIASESLARQAIQASVYRDTRLSDHAAVVMEYGF